MTCIVGVIDQGAVHIGGDSAAIGGHNIWVRTDGKIFRRGPFVFGFGQSFRMGQLLRYNLNVPEPPKDSEELNEFMAVRFVEATP